jgi:hypothetical protein
MTAMQDLVTEIDRVRYTEGQFLGAADFQDEQDYHRRALGRHEIGAHTWGIVAGFELVENPDPADAQFVDPVLSPGLAVDGYGRQIVSFGTVPIDSALFDAFTTDGHHSVWIEYDETTSRPAGDGFADCRDGEATRTVETFKIVIDPPNPASAVIVDGVPAATPPAPSGTPEIPADTSVPYQELPVEPPLNRWLVRLGSLHWDGTVGRFRPAAAGRLSEQRTYVGAIAASVLSPAGTLTVAPRTTFTHKDAADFVTVEGRLRTQGRINAQADIWLEGSLAHFASPGVEIEEDEIITLGRDTGTGAAKEQRLRLRLGDDAVSTTYLSIGTGGGVGTAVVEIHADGTLSIPTGLLDFGTTDRQDINLNGVTSGLGTQAGSVFFRSASEFIWYRGGLFSATGHDPGTGGQLQLVLDADGSFDFGARTRQMLSLWSSGGQHQYGIGVQDSTLYFRSGADVCWFKGGSHSDMRDNSGGGALQMKLDDTAVLSVTGNVVVGSNGDAQLITRHVTGKASGSDNPDSLYLNWWTGLPVVLGAPSRPSDLQVTGSLKVQSSAATAVQSVIKVKTYDKVVTNVGSAPGSWNQPYAGEFDQVLNVFATLAGFSVTGDYGSSNPGRYQDIGVIPQNVWVTVTSYDTGSATGQAFCAQSDATRDGNNQTGFTVVVLGRKWT